MNSQDNLIRPIAQGDAFLQGFNRVKGAEDGFGIAWLGQSGFLVGWKGHTLLFDPYLSDSLTRKYENTEKPHIRMTAKVIDPEKLDFVDVVTSSHNHTDHLDAETLKPLMKINPRLQIVIPEANRSFVVDRLECDPDWPTGLDAGGDIDVGPFQFHAVPAAHEDLSKDEQGRLHYLGYVVEFGGWTIYHSGDTLWYEGMEDILSKWSIDVAILPINGRAPERKVSGNLWGREAARLAKSISARCVVPCHYDMFTFNTATPEEFVQTCKEIGQPFRVLQAGEILRIPKTQ